MSIKTTGGKIAMTHAEFLAEGGRRFGPDMRQWRFVCPSCGYEQTVAQCLKAGMPESAVGFSCIGRWTGALAQFGERPGPCNYAGGGLFAIKPLIVTMPDGTSTDYFSFADQKGRK